MAFQGKGRPTSTGAGSGGMSRPASGVTEITPCIFNSFAGFARKNLARADHCRPRDFIPTSYHLFATPLDVIASYCKHRPIRDSGPNHKSGVSQMTERSPVHRVRHFRKGSISMMSNSRKRSPDRDGDLHERHRRRPCADRSAMLCLRYCGVQEANSELTV